MTNKVIHHHDIQYQLIGTIELKKDNTIMTITKHDLCASFSLHINMIIGEVFMHRWSQVKADVYGSVHNDRSRTVQIPAIIMNGRCRHRSNTKKQKLPFSRQNQNCNNNYGMSVFRMRPNIVKN